jgi:hypothetical protein
MSKQPVGIVLCRQLCFEAQMGELDGGSFRSGSENGLSLMQSDYEDLSVVFQTSIQTGAVKECCHHAILHCILGCKLD